MLLLFPIVPDLTRACSRCWLGWIPEQMIASTTDVEEDHPVHDPLALILKEHRLAMAAIWTVEIVSSSQGGVLHEVVDDTGLLFGNRHEIVSVDERFARFLLVVAVATRV